ncbi:MAG TPA: hypothetical protein VH416_05130 [Gaiellaceae bacterium]
MVIVSIEHVFVQAVVGHVCVSPCPVGRVLAEPGAPCVVQEVGGGVAEVLLVANHPCREAIAPEMATAAVSLVEPLGMDAAQPLHPAGELLLRRLEQQMDVIPHQRVCMAAPVVADDAFRQQREVAPAIVVVAEDLATVDAAHGDVVRPIGKV